MTTPYDTWKLRLNDPHFDSDYGSSPYKYDRRLKMWRDADTGRIVGKKKPKDD